MGVQSEGSIVGVDGQGRKDMQRAQLKMPLGRGERAKEQRVFRWRWREVIFESAHRAADGPSIESGERAQYMFYRKTKDIYP